MRLYALQPPRLQMYPPSLHDALPIWEAAAAYAYNRLHIVKDLGHEGPWYFHLKFLTYSYHPVLVALLVMGIALVWIRYRPQRRKIGKHTSELQSREKLVCRLLLETKN